MGYTAVMTLFFYHRHIARVFPEARFAPVAPEYLLDQISAQPLRGGEEEENKKSRFFPCRLQLRGGGGG